MLRSPRSRASVPFLINIIPATIVGAFAEGNVLQVLFVAVLFGAAFSRLGERGRPLIALLDGACAALSARSES